MQREDLMSAGRVADNRFSLDGVILRLGVVFNAEL